ncbi:ribonucleoside triphosphate reductase [Prosthecochloris sp. N3]|uniref:Ribonucleoside triphosphate reductase n=2 Tax=Prosthecochloris ethylica TaxID=2743976 RepID=A0ABR9XPC6_9CHLB|nr:ribonucleoside triphosphate reductase [Prosthecochloris ethylica]MBF0586123.1 ribonucleoside triphosphate reductase [Prosthecochloris ethylica]MBF0635829.1 ribonucleoside triphosphate reductase [Prosthecochloris ethylica]NUK47495.1 ribonucleoside triphosphate reductase [Prosthecochloris ethylica]
MMNHSLLSTDDARIIKRDGTLAPFDPEKITFAIFRALRATGKPDRRKAASLSASVVAKLQAFSEDAPPAVETIQDLVEEVLFEQGEFKAAKAYMIYRYQHSSLRHAREMFSNVDLVDDYLQLQDWRVKENANLSYSLQGLNHHISGLISSQYWLNEIYPPEIADAHRNGSLHIHDLGSLSVYCVGWDLEDLLLSGFRGVDRQATSRPARHLRSALGQIVNFFYTMQGEAAGAQAFSGFDTLLAPFIRFDDLSETEVRQCLQEFLFNMNVPTRVGFQTPFTNITMDLKVPENMKNRQVIVGGELQDAVYGDFQKEMDVFNRAFAAVMLEGDANGSVFSFPIPTYNITPDFDWENPLYDGIWEMAARYGIPYFSNFVNSDMSPDDVRSMCCRLRLDNRELQKRGGGLFGSNPLTGSIGVATVNLPEIGYLAGSEEEFFQRLRRVMELGRQSLEIKRKVIERFTEQGLYPYSRYYLRNLYAQKGRYWDNHFSTIGLIGMNECCMNFLGVPLTDPEGWAFSARVLDAMRDELARFQEETGHIYNLEATPAEGTSYRLARLDRERYPDILVANEEASRKGAEPYYTNSSQLPVNFTEDLFEALRLQDELQTRYTGGTVFHAFLGEQGISAESARRVVQMVTSNFRLPYLTLTPTFSICPEHGYVPGEHHECPRCAQQGERRECLVFSRIVGYLRPVEQWNAGKREEFSDRKLFDVPAVETV